METGRRYSRRRPLSPCLLVEFLDYALAELQAEVQHCHAAINLKLEVLLVLVLQVYKGITCTCLHWAIVDDITNLSRQLEGRRLVDTPK
jgi:hypothetical protein